MKMKNFSCMAIMGLMAAACTSQPAVDGYVLKGNIEGLPDGTHVQLVPVSHDSELPFADTTVVNGQFVFTGKMEEPRAFHLLVKDAYGSRNLMLENAQMEVTGKLVAKKESDGGVSYNLSSLSVKGSPLSARYDSLLSARTYLDSLYAFNARKFAAFDSLMMAAYKSKDQAKIKELRQSEDGKARAAADKVFFTTVDSLYHQVVMANKDSFWGPLMMISFTSYLSEDMKPWYEALSSAAKESYYGQKVKEELYPAGKEGTKVPDFKVKDKTGKEVSLSALRQGKKYVLIDFWASWCNPCRKEIPNLKKLYAQYSGKGFEIVSISIDQKKADWEKALKEEGLTWPNFLDETGVAALYKVKFVPTMYLITADGVTVGENLRGEALATKLKELFQ
ncbi:TlpA disulfide reductase family protein [Phocaeicola plebeius]|uniref:TlpA disulfide reductase family protein n=1 Tax=Phocaeicola plebeius TaxID=310297 RepID=UPI0021AC741B|nr:TlpA disulfide reductase family protein [Phocaeicola plebeius]MCR8884650.1 AhpC/TSA family protein [Phocaeicola plebeius]MDM8286656.1 TlpA disulfide reductase family protein [Phocaeicola plebeius]